LKLFRSKQLTTKRLTRFIGEIEHYDPLFTYRPGKLQTVPDALSRKPGVKEEGLPADTDRFMEISDEEAKAMETRRHQRSETRNVSEPKDQTRHAKRLNIDVLKKIRSYVKGKDPVDRVDPTVVKLSKGFRYEEGRLFRNGAPVLMEKEEFLDILTRTHGDVGHYGYQQIIGNINAQFVIASDLLKEGKELLERCKACQTQLRGTKTMDTATIHPYDKKEAFAFWEIDFVGPWPETSTKNRYLITAIDYATSAAIVHPIPARSSQVAIDLVEEIVWKYGAPLEILTDNGSEFTSDDFKAALERYGIASKKMTPGHPQSNGKVERLNYELLLRIQRICGEDGNKIEYWDRYIPRALFAFSAHKNMRWGATPFFLQYGVEPRLPTASQLTAPIL